MTKLEDKLIASVNKSPAQKTSNVFLDKPNGKPDPLQEISGIGAVLEEKLNKLGIYHFSQIASFSNADVAIVDDKLNFKGRINREEWIAQAKAKLATSSKTPLKTKSVSSSKTKAPLKAKSATSSKKESLKNTQQKSVKKASKAQKIAAKTNAKSMVSSKKSSPKKAKKISTQKGQKDARQRQVNTSATTPSLLPSTRVWPD